MSDILQQMGLKLTTFITGFIGALISLTYEKNLTVIKASVLVLSGTVSAGIVTPLLTHYLGLGDGLENSFAFIVGLIGMRVTRIFIDSLEENGPKIIKKFFRRR